jgi:hypothetical protein
MTRSRVASSRHPDLLGHEHGVPQGQEVQRAGGTVAPFGQQAAQHGVFW